MIDKDDIFGVFRENPINIEEELTKILEEEISKIQQNDWFIYNKDGTDLTIEEFLTYIRNYD
jgi:predicted nucleotidyltransferase